MSQGVGTLSGVVLRWLRHPGEDLVEVAQREQQRRNLLSPAGSWGCQTEVPVQPWGLCCWRHWDPFSPVSPPMVEAGPRCVPCLGTEQPLGSPTRIYSAGQSQESEHSSHLSHSGKAGSVSALRSLAQIPVGTAGQEMGLTCSSRCWGYSRHGRCSRIPPPTHFQPFSCFKAG